MPHRACFWACYQYQEHHNEEEGEQQQLADRQVKQQRQCWRNPRAYITTIVYHVKKIIKNLQYCDYVVPLASLSAGMFSSVFAVFRVLKNNLVFLNRGCRLKGVEWYNDYVLTECDFFSGTTTLTSEVKLLLNQLADILSLIRLL